MPGKAPHVPSGAATPSRAVLMRTIMPPAEPAGASSLYVDAGPATPMAIRPRPSAKGYTDPDGIPISVASPPVPQDAFRSRTSIHVGQSKRFSTAAYFNAFPASYWRASTTVRDVQLVVTTSGRGTVTLCCSNARGKVRTLTARSVDGDSTLELDVSLDAFLDGGWCWFDLAGGEGGLTLHGAEWTTQDPAPPTPRILLQITTMNKRDYCIRNLNILADHPECLALVSDILLVDQGTELVEDSPELAAVAERLGGRLRIIRQSNLGGSGGFARGMYEALEGAHDYVLLLDDDVVVEPESITRLATFGSWCASPTIVGGHMFDMHRPDTLHSLGESVDRHRFFWQDAHPAIRTDHSFTTGPLRHTAWLHRRYPVDYNAWWMCLVPRQALASVGLAAPYFIKWDDVEYGVRASNAGISTVSLPGAAVWHLPWADKDDVTGWQAYFHVRNRLVSTLVHSDRPGGGRLLRELAFHDVRHLLNFRYGTVAIRHRAMRDVLSGPDHLVRSLPTTLPEVAAELRQHPENEIKPFPSDFPPPTGGGPAPAAHNVPMSGATLYRWALRQLFRQLTRPVPRTARERPQAQVSAIDGEWWIVPEFDSVVLSTVEGTGARWFVRRRRSLWTSLIGSLRLTAEIRRRWSGLRTDYREEFGHATSAASWREVFEEHTVSDRRY